MIAKTQNQRKAAERARKREAGLVKIEIWCRPKDRAKIIRFAASLNKPPV